MNKVLLILTFFILFFIPFFVPQTFASNFRKGLVQWKSIPDVSYYHIYYKENGGKTYNYAVPDVPGTSTEYMIGGLKQGVSYEYKIVAFNSGKQLIWQSERRWIWNYQ